MNNSLFTFSFEGMSLEGSLQTQNCQATRQSGELGSEVEMSSGVLWGLIPETIHGVVRLLLGRPGFLMWYTMHLTMSWSELKLWWRVPSFRLMLHLSSSGIFSTMELMLVARRKLQLWRKRERYELFLSCQKKWLDALCIQRSIVISFCFLGIFLSGIVFCVRCVLNDFLWF